VQSLSFSVLSDYLKMSKLSARWVQFVDNQFVDFFEFDPVKFVRQIVTADETWVHHWDLERAKSSRCSGNMLHPRKFKTLLGKLMATICWDSKGLLPSKTTMYAQYYTSLLLKLRDAIKE